MMGPWKELLLRPLPDGSGFEVIADGLPVVPVPGEELSITLAWDETGR